MGLTPRSAAGGLREEKPLRFRNYRSLPINNNRTTVVVSISVAITVAPNNIRPVVISAIPILKVFTVTIAITKTFTHRYAKRTCTDSDLLRASRNCAKNTRHGGHRYCVSDHCLLP